MSRGVEAQRVEAIRTVVTIADRIEPCSFAEATLTFRNHGRATCSAPFAILSIDAKTIARGGK